LNHRWYGSFQRFAQNPPHIFIFSSKEQEPQMNFEGLKPEEAQKLTLLLGEIARRERNITFHDFRHFFNSTMRGTVSDDILRLPPVLCIC
jgi:diadenosine tetraphosphate (Ap4A) HIT family hydrolase